MNCKINGCEQNSRALGLCGKHYQRLAKHGDVNWKPSWDNAPEICIIEGCERDATRKSSGMCEKHYYRVRRNGKAELTATKRKERWVNSAGYIKVLDINHPLADSTGYIYEHRKVVYQSNPVMKCFHCGKKEAWSTCHIDHLDDSTDNNDISNLVVSCARCNKARGKSKLEKTLIEKYAISYKDKLLTVIGWGRELGISHNAMQYRLDNWTDKDRIFTAPRGKTGPVSTRIT